VTWPPAGPGGAPIFGGQVTKDAFTLRHALWSAIYVVNDGQVPDLQDSELPKAFQGIPAKVVVSSGGAASGIVTEGMGYGILVEGFQAILGNSTAVTNGIALTRAWLGMVNGPKDTPKPFGGGNTDKDAATKVGTYPYGVSAIRPQGGGVGPSGVAAWKYPLDQCAGLCTGSATDGDEDAVLGMIYLAAALKYPDDFVDTVMRAVISFASADLGFPDLYRTLPDGSKMFVPKGGSQWGGLLPAEGPLKSAQEPFCYNPSYFSPGHYRAFRDFASAHWRSGFDAYLPPHQDGSASTLKELIESFDGAVTAGYNLLFHSSCADSGAVANWVGGGAACDKPDALNCAGVPWATTPYIGQKGECTASGTAFGAWGADASRTPWRIALDYVLYTEESGKVKFYDQAGKSDPSSTFNAQTYLNRFANHYKKYSGCDGGKGECKSGDGKVKSYEVAKAFTGGAPGITCDNVPNTGDQWWAAFMSYPTFTAFVAPDAGMTAEENKNWLDTFGGFCKASGDKLVGGVCGTAYFDLGQEVISTMIMAGALVPLPQDTEPVAV